MATTALDILLNFQSKTDALTTAAAEVLKLSAANRTAEAEARKLAESTRAAQGSARGFLDGFSSGASKIAGLAAVFTGVQLSISGLLSTVRGLVTGATEMADRFEHVAQRIDASFTGVQVLGQLARDFGQDVTVFTTGVDSLNRRLAQAKAGSLEAIEPFHRLRLTIAEFEGLQAERKLELLARAIAQAEDRNAAFLDGVEILGQAAAPALEAALVRLGEEGFDQLAESMTKAGRVISVETGRQLRDAKTALEDLRNEFVILFGELAAGYIGATEAAARFAVELKLPGRTERGLTIERVQEIRTRTNSVGSEEDVARVREQLRREAAEMRALINAQDVIDLDRRTPQSPNEGARAEGMREILAELEESIRILDNPILSSVLVNMEAQERAATALAAAAKDRALREEAAGVFLQENAQKIEAQIKAAQDALLPDRERLAVMEQQLAAARELAAERMASAAGPQDAERVRLESAREIATLDRDVAQLRERVGKEAERIAESERQAALKRLELEVRRRENAIETLRLESEAVELRGDISGPEKERQIAAIVAEQRDLVREIVDLKEQALVFAGEEEKLRLESELARLRAEQARAGAPPRAPGAPATGGETTRLTREQRDLALGIERSVDGMAGAFVDAASGARDFGSAAKQVLAGLARDIAVAIARALILRTVLSFFGGGGGSGIGAAVAASASLAGGGAVPRYTGPGSKFQPAGVVHAGEFVHTQEAVERAGGPGFFYDVAEFVRVAPRTAIARVQAAIQGPISDHLMLEGGDRRSFASGGYVGGAMPAAGMAFPRSRMDFSDVRFVVPGESDGDMGAASARDLGRAASAGPAAPVITVPITVNFEAGVTPTQFITALDAFERRVPAVVRDAINRASHGLR